MATRHWEDPDEIEPFVESRMARRSNVKLQVLPYLVGAHPGMTSAFTIVSFAEHLVDHLAGEQY